MKSLSNFLFDLVKVELASISDPTDTAKIENFIAVFPFSDRIAFELPLDESKGIDFHLNYRDDRPRTKHQLYSFLQSNSLTEGEGWQRLNKVLQLWQSENGIYHNFIDHIFLEFDSSLAFDKIPVPAFFTRINEDFDNTNFPSFLQKLIIDLRGEGFLDEIKSKLQNCIDALPHSASFRYAGFMLSRPEKAIRINIYKLKIHELLPYLQKIGWKGNEVLLQEYAEWIYRNADGIILSFDIVGEHIHPRIGLEISMDNHPKEDLRWNYLFQEIEKRGILTTAKKNFILNARKEWTPKDIPWHSELVANSLAHQYETLDFIKFFLSHIKIVFDKEQAKAKAYFGICQSFTQKAAIKYHPFPIQEAILKGKNYVLKSQKQGGFFNDFKIFGAVADQWTSAFVLLHLLEIDENIKQNSDFSLAINTLISTKKEKGWGYCHLVEPDADSTFLTISLLKKINHPQWLQWYNEAKSNFINSDGGLGTYKNSPLKSKETTEWNNSHLCVSAAANCLHNDFENYLLAELQNAEKLTYWWTSNAYSLYFLTKANLHAQEPKILEWLQEEIINSENNQNIFHLSLLTLSAMHCKLSAFNIEPIVEFILQHQTEKGNWRGDAQMLKNDGTANFVIDQNNLFTTTMATLALHKFHHEYQ